MPVGVRHRLAYDREGAPSAALTLAPASAPAAPGIAAIPAQASDGAGRIGWRFLSAYTIAQVGAFVAFMPLLQLLAPLKAAAIDPQHKTILLGQAMFLGAVAASVSNLLAGAASDRTRSRFG